MKKAISCMLVCCLMIGLFVLPTSAEAVVDSETVIQETTETLEDGTVITITLCEENTPIARATTTKSGSKTYTAKNADGAVLWSFKVKGTFSVNSGVSATCTAVSHSHSITESAWSCKTSSSSKSGNTATGTATFVKKVLFITTDTKDCTVTLKCDKNGNLS